MNRWRRRIRLAVGVVVAAVIVRTAWSLWPPTVPPGAQWEALTGVTVINPGRDRRANQTVTLRDGRIASIVDRVPDSTLRSRARLYDGRYILPGLIDMDVRHIPDAGPLQTQFGMLFLMAGVTTVRDLGSFDSHVADLRHRIEAGDVPWPRLIACGLVVGDSPECPGRRAVRNAADARRAVDELAAMGVRCVTVDQSLDAAILAAVQAAARARGLSVVGNEPPGSPSGPAPLDDVLLISAAPRTATAAGVADWLRAWQIADPAAVDALAGAASARETAYTSSLGRWINLTGAVDPRVVEHLRTLLPRFHRERWWERERAALPRRLASGNPPPAGDSFAGAVSAMSAAVARLHAAGVRIHVGSGTPGRWLVPGLSLWGEMTYLAAAGVPVEAVWAAATRVAGESLGIAQLGVIEPGAPADLLIFRDDPTSDLAALRSLEAVVARGRLYPTVYLNRNVLEYARYFEGTAYDRLSVLLARLTTWWEGDTCTEEIL